MLRSTRSFPPYELLRQSDVSSATEKTKRLERLYHLTREHAWDGPTVLRELIEKHGPPGSAVSPELRPPLARLLTVLLWGELAAWNISADLALAIDDVDAKMAATGQVFDEARHFSVLREYVVALGPDPSIGAFPRALLRKVLDAPTLAQKLVGMQLLFETNAVVIFRRIAESGICPILSELLPYFERDESRHVGLGVMYLPKLVRRMSKADARRTVRFHTECILLLMASGFTFRDDFESLGLDPRMMANRVTKMQSEVIREMVEHHGRSVARVVVDPTDGVGPKIVDFIHPPGGVASTGRTHRTLHRGLTRALTTLDRALA
jgi:hypothetical protein